MRRWKYKVDHLNTLVLVRLHTHICCATKKWSCLLAGFSTQGWYWHAEIASVDIPKSSQGSGLFLATLCKAQLNNP